MSRTLGSFRRRRRRPRARSIRSAAASSSRGAEADSKQTHAFRNIPPRGQSTGSVSNSGERASNSP